MKIQQKQLLKLMLFFTGLCFLLISLNVSNYLLPFDKQTVTQLKSRILYQYHSWSTMNDPYYGETIEIRITYPQTMRLGDSDLVELQILEFSENSDSHRPKSIDEIGIKKIPQFLEVTCSGANFVIKPTETFTIKQGSQLPYEIIWSIAPQKSGAQSLVINLGDFNMYHSSEPLHGNDFFHIVNITENSVKRTLPDNYNVGFEKYKIKVVTPVGIPDTVFQVTKYILGILSFIMMYPAVSEKITNLGRKNIPKARRTRRSRKI